MEVYGGADDEGLLRQLPSVLYDVRGSIYERIWRRTERTPPMRDVCGPEETDKSEGKKKVVKVGGEMFGQQWRSAGRRVRRVGA